MDHRFRITRGVYNVTLSIRRTRNWLDPSFAGGGTGRVFTHSKTLRDLRPGHAHGVLRCTYTYYYYTHTCSRVPRNNVNNLRSPPLSGYTHYAREQSHGAVKKRVNYTTASRVYNARKDKERARGRPREGAVFTRKMHWRGLYHVPRTRFSCNDVHVCECVCVRSDHMRWYCRSAALY